MSEVIPFRGFSLHDQVAERIRALIFDRQLAPGEFIDQRVNFGLGADIDAASRFVEDQYFRTTGQPLSEDDFLLIPTGQQPHNLRRVGSFDPELVDHFRVQRLFGTVIQKAPVTDTIEVGQREIGPDAGFENEAVLPSIFRNQQDSSADRIGRFSDPNSFAIQQHAASGLGTQPEDGFRKFGATGADQPRHPENFARADSQ